MHRRRIFLSCRNKSMAYFMVSNNAFLLFGYYRALALITGNNNFHRFLKIALRYAVAVHTYCTQRSLVDDIGKFGTGSTAGSAGNGLIINIGFGFNIFGMYAQNCFASLQIRQLNRYAPVKTSGAQKCFIQRIGSVGSSQNYYAFTAVKAVHFRKQLV